MGNTIGAKIVLEGEKEYREAIKNINSEQKELRSEMKLVTSEFADQQNSLEALTAKHSVLEKQIQSQNEKIEIYAKAVESSTEAQKKAADNIEMLSGELEKAQKEMDAMSESSETSAEALAAQQKVIDELKGKIASAEKEYANAEKSTRSWQTSLNNAQADLNNMNSDLSKLEGYMQEAEESTDKCAKSIDAYGKAVKESGDNSEQFGKKGMQAIEALSQAIATEKIAEKAGEIKDALMECAQVAAAFEKDIAQVGTIADESQKSLGDIKKEIIDASSELGVAAGELTNATYSALSAGIDTANAVSFTATATKLAVGGFTEANTAVDILTTTLNAYNLSAENATQISDYLVTTQNLGKTTVAELASAMGKVIPIAAAYNVQMDNLSSAYALLTAGGIATAESTTYLKSMLNELGDTGSKVSDALGEETGKTFAQLTKEGKSLGDVLDIIYKNVGEDTVAFNNLWSSSEAGVGALSLVSAGAEKYNKTLEQMQKSTGATEKAFQKMSSTTEYAEKKMQVALQNMKIAIGDELNPAMEEMYNTGADAFDWAADFVKEHPEVVSAVTAITIAMGGFAASITAAKVAMIALNAVMDMNPAVVLASAVIALGAALTTLSLNAADASSELDQIIEKSKESNEQIRENIENRKKENDSIEQNAKYSSSLADELTKLSQKETLSADETTRMRNAVDQLNQMYPNLNLKIDENTNKIIGNTDAISANVKQMQEQEKMTVLQEKYGEALKDVADAEVEMLLLQEERAKAEEKLAELEDERAKVVAEYAEQKSKSAQSEADYNAELAYLTNRITNATDAVESLKEQEEEYKSTIEATTEEIQTYSDAIDKQTGILGKAEEETKNLTSASIEYKGTMYDVTEEVAENILEIQSAYIEARQSAEESLSAQVGMFEELNIKSDMTAQQMAQNLDSQTAAFEQYNADLETLKSSTNQGIQEILEDLSSMGMEGAGYVHELANATDEEMENIVNSFKKAQDAKKELSDTLADIQTGYSDQMDELLGIQEEKQAAYLEAEEQWVQESVEMIAQSGADGVEELKSSLEDAQSAIEEGTEDLIIAVDEMCTSMIEETNTKLEYDGNRSAVFYRIGKSIPTSMAQAVNDGTSEFVNAVSNMIQKAADAAVAKAEKAARDIDKALGSKIK